MWKTVLDLLFPIYCLGCGQEGDFICFDCFKKLPLNKKLFLRLNPKDNLNGLIITSSYRHPLVKEIVRQFKYNFIKDLAKPLGRLMSQKLNSFSDFFDKNNSILIPVPLHKKRLRWRGFNQAELLALEVGQKLNIKVANNILQRIKHGLPQTNIKSSQIRKENIKQAFSLKPKEVRPSKRGPYAAGGRCRSDRPDLCLSNNFSNKTIILVDDISTTGATLEECARALKPLKPKQIWGLVIAKG